MSERFYRSRSDSLSWHSEAKTAKKKKAKPDQSKLLNVDQTGIISAQYKPNTAVSKDKRKSSELDISTNKFTALSFHV
jgi:hypothetical protein